MATPWMNAISPSWEPHADFVNSEVSRPFSFRKFESLSATKGWLESPSDSQCCTLLTAEIQRDVCEKLKGHYLAGKEISEFPQRGSLSDFQKMRSLVSKVHFNKRISMLFQCTTLLPICNLPFVSNSAGGGIVRSEPVLSLSPIPAMQPGNPWHPFPAIPPNTMRGLCIRKKEKTRLVPLYFVL